MQTAVSSLLALAGIDGEPLKSREHILLSTILLAAWQAGESPDLATLIQRVQQPPMTRDRRDGRRLVLPGEGSLRVCDVDQRADRVAGIRSLEPGRAARRRARSSAANAGKPRVSIFSIAHLDDSQRMFFVALLLNAVAGWMRRQTGTSSLRAMVYMDEIFGFFPPVANPPSKGPLLTLLKQGRAAGVGVVLATQNPGRSRLQGPVEHRHLVARAACRPIATRRACSTVSKARAIQAASIARKSTSLLSGLTSRVFLMRNVHEDALTLFQSRWALSYLRGPLGRDEIKKLTAERRRHRGRCRGRGVDVDERQRRVQRRAPAASSAAGGARPVLPPASRSTSRRKRQRRSRRRFVRWSTARSNVRFADPKLKIDTTKLVDVTTPIRRRPRAGRLGARRSASSGRRRCSRPMRPTRRQVRAICPSAASKAKNYDAWTKQLAASLCPTQALELLQSPSTGEMSRPDESERDFRARISHRSRENRDRELDAIRKKYAPRQAALDEKLRRASRRWSARASRRPARSCRPRFLSARRWSARCSAARAISASTIGRATTAARGVGRTMKESEDIARAKETVAAIEEQRKQLDADFAAETAALDAANDAATETLEKSRSSRRRRTSP